MQIDEISHFLLATIATFGVDIVGKVMYIKYTSKVEEASMSVHKVTVGTKIRRLKSLMSSASIFPMTKKSQKENPENSSGNANDQQLTVGIIIHEDIGEKIALATVFVLSSIFYEMSFSGVFYFKVLYIFLLAVLSQEIKLKAVHSVVRLAFSETIEFHKLTYLTAVAASVGATFTAFAASIISGCSS
jgi:hypothetical protein